MGSFSSKSCPSLKTLHIPNSIQFIDVSISSQLNIEIDGGLDSVIEGTCGQNAKFKFDKHTGTLRIYGSGNIEAWNYKWHLYKERIKKVSIEGKISHIQPQAFIYCTNLESVYMTNHIKTIDKSSFSNCRSLKEISIPQSVSVIRNGAFTGCTSLSNITIPQTVKPIEVGENLFTGCSPNLVVKAPKNLKGKMKEEDYIKIEYY